MRQKRAKTYKRVMALYTQTFGFRTPFQMLVSQDIMLKCPAELNLMKALHSCVQAETKFMITQCCMEALYKLGKDYQQVTNLAKRFERRRCNHREAIDPDACLKDTIGQTNKHNYVLAAQSASLRQSLNNVAGLPIIHFNPRQVLVLSPPSIATTRHKNAIEEKRRLEGGKELEGVEDGDNVIGAGTSTTGSGPSKEDVTRGASGRKKIKGPNPLSVKRKKAEKRPREEHPEEGEGEEDGEGEDVNERSEGGANGTTVARDEEDGEGGKRRKKRKRGKGKGAVAEARAELMGELQAARSRPVDNGDAGGDGSDDE